MARAPRAKKQPADIAAAADRAEAKKQVVAPEPAAPEPVRSNVAPRLSDLEHTLDRLNKHLADNPVLEDQETSNSTGVIVARLKECMRFADGERRDRCIPFEKEIDGINGEYKPKRTEAQRLVDEGNSRMTAYARAEKDKREAAAAAAAEAARLAEEEARAAEAREQEALDNAAQGEIGIDVRQHTRDADEKFAEHRRASRFAKVAEKDTKVKVNTGGRNLSMRKVETLHLRSMKACWEALNEDEREGIVGAFLVAGRAHRKRTKILPPGIEATFEEEFR